MTGKTGARAPGPGPTRPVLPTLAGADDSPSPAAGPTRWARHRERKRRSRRRRVLRVVGLASLLFVLVFVVTWGRAMLRPSSVSLGIRTVEWVRANGGAWLVNDVERLWYGWHAPKPGGPPLKALPVKTLPPAVKLPPRATARARVPVARAWRPARIAPTIRPALPDEGVWHPIRADLPGGPPVLVALYRPQPQYPRLVAYVGWIDHTRTRLALYPGRYEPPRGAPRGPMSVPLGQRARLLATFNSGFTYRDGRGGFVVDGHVYEPLQKGIGTLVAYRDGRVDVRSWQGGPAGSPQVVLARQNLPLIVDHGRASPNLNDGPQWGATLGNAILVWRSAVGIDRHGNLLYAAANDQTARSLAALMVHIGAVRAIELDINAEWPSFIAYGGPGAQRPLKVVPNYQQRDTRYLSPDDRDFFAVYTRVGGGAAVPFR